MQVVDPAVDMEVAAFHPGGAHGRHTAKRFHLGLHIEFREASEARCAFGDGCELPLMSGRYVSYGLNPVVDGAVRAAVHRGGDTAAPIVAADDDMPHLQFADCVFQYRDQVEIAGVDQIGDVAVDEHLARLRSRDQIGGYAAVRAADPKGVGRLARFVPGEAGGIFRYSCRRPGLVARKEFAEFAHDRSPFRLAVPFGPGPYSGAAPHAIPRPGRGNRTTHRTRRAIGRPLAERAESQGRGRHWVTGMGKSSTLRTIWNPPIERTEGPVARAHVHAERKGTAMVDEAAGRPEPAYTMGYSEEFQRLLDRRRIETHAKHLLPHLEPGLGVLDLGCGPGNFAVGLAKAVHPGEMHGIDMEASQIDIARAAAEAGGHDNARFHVGNALELPFDDGRFDVVHCHAVIMHIPQTEAVLAEIRRVLKPGGIVACREMIGDSSFAEPDFGNLAHAWRTFERLLAANGGHPQMGKELRNRLHEAGFVDIESGASFEVFATPPDVAFFHGVVQDWFLSPPVVEAATKHGVATHQQFDAWRDSLEKWKAHPGAVGGLAWGEAVARNP